MCPLSKKRPIQKFPEETLIIERGVGDVMQHFEYMELATAKKAIKELTEAKGFAEAQIEDCIKNMNIEQEMLDGYMATKTKPDEAELLGRKACQLGIKAWKSSLKHFKDVVDAYQKEIENIAIDLPDHLREYLLDEKDEPDYPLIAVSAIPTLLEKLSLGVGYPRYAVLMFLPQDSEEYVNLQYSVEDGSIGLDWVLLGGRNIKDKKAVIELANNLGYKFIEYEMNKVRYLRVETKGIAELGMKILGDIYHLDKNIKIKLLVQGFHWKY